MNKTPFHKLPMAKTTFKQVVADVSYVDDFKVELPTSQMKQSIITLYNIGGIDTLFDASVYFSDWVEHHEIVDENISRSSQDYRHGTAVSSIIVDGSRLNPWLNDGCGRFRVRHFGVAAPWISRKLSYLINVMGLEREVAKTIIIDSARGWSEQPTPEEVALYGHGVVPIKIEDIKGDKQNLSDDFIKNCTLNGWLVNVVDVRNRIDIHKKVNEDIEFN